MKSYVLTGLESMELREVTTPSLSKGLDVLLRIASVGICGSDVHYYATGRIGCQVVQYPFTVGHECSAIVEQVGRDVSTVRPGDRVAVEPAMPCGYCDQCRCGREHTCRNLRFLGCPGQAEGCLSEFLVMPESSCLVIPPAMTLEQAALGEPLSIGLYAVRLSGLAAGMKVGILGAGPIGLSVMEGCHQRGVSRVYMTDKIPERLGMGEKRGASWTGNPLKEEITAAVSRKEPLLLDVVFECCGQQEAVDQAFALLKPGGKLVMVGIPEVDRISLPIDLARRKEIAFINVRRQNHCLRPALDLIASGAGHFSQIITHRFGFDQTREAFELVHGYRDGVVKAVVNLIPPG